MGARRTHQKVGSGWVRSVTHLSMEGVVEKKDRKTGETLQIFANFWLGVASAGASGFAQVTKKLHDYDWELRASRREGRDEPLPAQIAHGLKITLDGAVESLRLVADEAKQVREELYEEDCSHDRAHLRESMRAPRGDGEHRHPPYRAPANDPEEQFIKKVNE
jgi:hypothetical protein